MLSKERIVIDCWWVIDYFKLRIDIADVARYALSYTVRH